MNNGNINLIMTNVNFNTKLKDFEHNSILYRIVRGIFTTCFRGEYSYKGIVVIGINKYIGTVEKIEETIRNICNLAMASDNIQPVIIYISYDNIYGSEEERDMYTSLGFSDTSKAVVPLDTNGMVYTGNRTAKRVFDSIIYDTDI